MELINPCEHSSSGGKIFTSVATEALTIRTGEVADEINEVARVTSAGLIANALHLRSVHL